MQPADAIQITRDWISSMVIGLGLCPFAEKVFKAERIHYAVTTSADPTELLRDLGDELQRLVEAPREKIETSILIAPNTLADFLDFNDFLGIASTLVEELQLDGVIQVVGFHPQFQFGDSGVDDVENYTNRSPYPFLHLLREESISELKSSRDELLAIPKRNSETLRELGLAKVLARLKGAHN